MYFVCSMKQASHIKKKLNRYMVLELVFKDETVNPNYFSILGTEYLFKIFKTLPPLYKRDPFLPFVQIQ